MQIIRIPGKPIIVRTQVNLPVIATLQPEEYEAYQAEAKERGVKITTVIREHAYITAIEAMQVERTQYNGALIVVEALGAE